MSTSQSFTGRTRQRTTRRGVLVVDTLARSLISVGGIATILAVLGVFLFLVWVVLPLFLPAKVEGMRTFEGRFDTPPAHLAVDEYGLLGWVLDPAGRIEVFRLDTGAARARQELFPATGLVSWSFLTAGEGAVFGLDDGTVRTVEISFETQVLDSEDLSAAVRRQFEDGAPDQVVDFESGVLQRTPGGQFRLQQLVVHPGTTIQAANGIIHRVGYTLAASGPLITALVETEEGAVVPPGTVQLVVIRGNESSNFLTGETTLIFDAPVAVPFEPLGEGLPSFLGISGTGADLYVAWADGHALRLDISDLDNAFVAERGQLAVDGLSAVGFVLGNNTLAWADSAGHIAAGFPVQMADFTGEGVAGLRQEEGATTLLVMTKDLARGKASVGAIAASARSRLLLTGDEAGTIRLFNVTTATQLTTAQLPVDEPVVQITIGPKEDILAVATARQLFVADLDPRYTDASFKALFQPVWYEGYSAPIHSWQSSSATDDFEPKHSLMPLIFGTLKATLYSMLFGVPLALLAAVFTSEFLDPRVRSAIKPTIELMASLPSVVLGFLAALVIAPFVERIVPATLASFLTLPLAFLLGAYVWQLLPASLTIRLERWRFAFMALMLPLGFLLAAWIGPRCERWFFAGDLKGWMAWGPGATREEAFHNATGGWLFLTLPAAFLVVAFVLGRYINPFLRQQGTEWDRRRFALADLSKFAVGLIAALFVAWITAVLLQTLGLDPRGGYLDTFQQRNALVVGFVMGFAIIPIIYTLSEDALSTVPEHLRSASLGAGATRWQTAVRIVIPTAMSGLFSAMMIGLGRAVGETMIVLMAAGNTPVMSWNIFEGFRTLSANIAVELPEAVAGSTHYRTLFLAALVLFIMTFIVNTVAEIVRLRFRRRAFQL